MPNENNADSIPPALPLFLQRWATLQIQGQAIAFAFAWNADPMQRFLQATGQHAYARFLLLQRAQEDREARAVDEANESLAFPSHHRAPGT